MEAVSPFDAAISTILTGFSEFLERLDVALTIQLAWVTTDFSRPVAAPAFQPMDIQLNAPSTLPVLARTVSGCVNSAFLNISQHFTSHLFRPWRPSSARGGDDGPRRFTEPKDGADLAGGVGTVRLFS